MEIKINNNTYKIYFVDNHNDKLLMEDEQYHTGVTYFIGKEIYIRNDLNVDTFKYTAFHELTHAYLESYGFLQVDYTDEIVCDIVGNYITNIYDDFNKILHEYNKIEEMRSYKTPTKEEELIKLAKKYELDYDKIVGMTD